MDITALMMRGIRTAYVVTKSSSRVLLMSMRFAAWASFGLAIGAAIAFAIAYIKMDFAIEFENSWLSSIIYICGGDIIYKNVFLLLTVWIVLQLAIVSAVSLLFANSLTRRIREETSRFGKDMTGSF